jgi:hypothetical protein
MGSCALAPATTVAQIKTPKSRALARWNTLNFKDPELKRCIRIISIDHA